MLKDNSCPIVSIIIPVYNREQLLKQCVDSVLCQTLGDFEVIIIDDCSSDNTLNVAREYSAKDSRITVLHNEKNVGPAVSRNRAFAIATGKYIMMLDSDDTLPNYVVEKINEFLVDEPDTIAFELAVFDDKNCPIPNRLLVNDGIPDGIAMYSKVNAGRAFRRDSLTTHNIRYPEGKLCEDSIFGLYTAYFLDNVVYTNVEGYNVVNHAGSLSHDYKLYAKLSVKLLPLDEFRRLILMSNKDIRKSRNEFIYFCYTFGMLACFLWSKGGSLSDLKRVVASILDSLSQLEGKSTLLTFGSYRKTALKSDIRKIQHIATVLFTILMNLHLVGIAAAVNNLFYRAVNCLRRNRG